MDVLDKFLYSIAYKFPKGYPDMNNEQDILMLENILKEKGISLSIKEGTKSSNTRKAKEALLNSPEGKNAGLTQMTATYRIGNKNKIDKDKFIEVINKVFNTPKLTVHSPKEGPNTSSKYNMFEFEMEGEGLVQLYLAGGANEGEKYEQNLLEKMKSSAGLSMNEIQHEDVKQIFTSLGIDPTKITPEDINFAGASDTSRQLSFDGPQEIGSTISDVTIDYPGKIYYLSIKNKKGSAIYNGGNIPFIVQNEDGKVIFDQSKYNEKPLFAEIFDTLGIDSQKVADGLNNYVNKTGGSSSFESAQGIDLNKVKNLLASSFGYGYWYIREKSGNKIFTYHVATAEDAYKMVGDLKSDSVKVKYPGPNTKVLEVRIETNSEVLEGGPRVPLVYQIVARNAAGKLLPMRMNIRTNK
tara:strand:- start:132 stop:1364 length:1233 start_codon:yes stop_codon:yes gene_type:complete